MEPGGLLSYSPFSWLPETPVYSASTTSHFELQPANSSQVHFPQLQPLTLSTSPSQGQLQKVTYSQPENLPYAFAGQTASGCTGGASNAPGCRHGQTWCKDPRCHPFCPGCVPKVFHKTAVSALNITLGALLLIGAFIALAIALSNNGRGDREISFYIRM